MTMAKNDSTQSEVAATKNPFEEDPSRFGLQSYKWRSIKMDSDRVVRLMEKAYQTSYAVEGLSEMLITSSREADFHGGITLNNRQQNQLLGAISLMSVDLHDSVSEFAESIDKAVKESERKVGHGRQP
jgi:hypothetical protein